MTRGHNSPLGFSEKVEKALNFRWHMEWRFELFYLLIEGRGNPEGSKALGNTCNMMETLSIMSPVSKCVINGSVMMGLEAMVQWLVEGLSHMT